MRINKTGVLVAVLLVGFAVLVYAISRPKPMADDDLNVNQPDNSTKIMNSSTFDIQGMKVEIIKEGAGAVAKNGDTVTVNYTGALEDGKIFDSSLGKGESPFSFHLGAGEVIKGWDLGVAGMKIGEQRRLTIPANLGYGATGTPGGPIPPNATLIFDVELLSVE